MTNEEILANAPDGSTHYIKNGEYKYWRLTYINGYQAFTNKTGNLINVMPSKLYNLRSLSDIRRIVELEKQNAALKKAEDLLLKSTKVVVSYKGIIPFFVYDFDKDLKQDLSDFMLERRNTK